jgi:hypothetical protein
MTKHTKFSEEQEKLLIKLHSRIKNGKGKLKVDLVRLFQEHYPNSIANYNQLNYVIMKRLNVNIIIC